LTSILKKKRKKKKESARTRSFSAKRFAHSTTEHFTYQSVNIVFNLCLEKRAWV